MNKCETCEHWDRERWTDPDGKWQKADVGQCTLISYKIIYDGATAAASLLETKDIFGCVLWEAKDE